MAKLRLTFKFFDTEERAVNFCFDYNANASYYMRKNKPAHYTPWNSSDGKENKFIVWYYY